jgi:hypothetical protein
MIKNIQTRAKSYRKMNEKALKDLGLMDETKTLVDEIVDY